jgi:tripartite-type tricarboxylate transporter receptor subunit TctC
VKIFGNLIWLVVASFIGAFSTQAAAPFYEGKSIKLIVGFSAGGGFDTYSRLIARHMGKHIPGSPAIIVENMTRQSGRRKPRL